MLKIRRNILILKLLEWVKIIYNFKAINFLVKDNSLKLLKSTEYLEIRDKYLLISRKYRKSIICEKE
jgi:hypothetical protein